MRALLVFVACLSLVSCREEERGREPEVIVDPGPPFGPGLKLRAAQRLDDGSVVLIVEVAQ